jgi:hypothetical protein
VNDGGEAPPVVHRSPGGARPVGRHSAMTDRGRDAWYWRLAMEARNVVIVILIGVLALAALVGAVIVVTAITVQ